MENESVHRTPPSNMVCSRANTQTRVAMIAAQKSVARIRFALVFMVFWMPRLVEARAKDSKGDCACQRRTTKRLWEGMLACKAGEWQRGRKGRN